LTTRLPTAPLPLRMKRQSAGLRKHRGQSKIQVAAQDLSADLIAAAQQVVEIAQVSDPRRRAELAAQIALFAHRARWLFAPEGLNKLEVIKHRLRAAASAFENAAAKLRAAIDEYDAYHEICKETRLDYIAPSPIDKLLKEVEIWAFLRAQLSPSRRGRPSGSSKPDLRWFTLMLLCLVEEAGGRLTLDKNYPDRATLLDALQLLRPHLPDGLVPASPSIRTLLLAKREVRNGNKGLRGAIFQSYIDDKI
jgi:hypothetical protein